MLIDFSARSSSVMPSPGAAGTRMTSPLARKAGSVVPPAEMYCGPLSAAGVFNPAHAKRWTDAARDKSRSVSPEANMSRLFSRSKLTILDAFQSPPQRATFMAIPSNISSAGNSATSTGETMPSSIRWQRALPLQTLIAAYQVRRERRLQAFEAGLRELGCHRKRGFHVIVGVRVRPVKTIGREIAHRAGKLEIIFRRLRIAELDIETVIAPRPGERELRLCTGHRRRLNGPTELHRLLSRTAENLGHAAISLLAPQVVASKVHRRFAQRLANRKRRPDCSIHPFVDCCKI